MLIGDPIGYRLVPHSLELRVSILDTASGSTGKDLIGRYTLADSGSGSEQVFAGILKRVFDNAIGTSEYQITGQVVVTGAATGSSGVFLPVKGYVITDSASGNDILTLSPQITDSATGTSDGNLFAQLGIQDSGGGSGILDLSGIEKLFSYLGSLEPDESLVIDADGLIVTKGESNERANFDGNFPKLQPGIYDLKYSDGQDSTTVEIEIKKEDLHV